MPRKADEREFGFRSQGILRILTSADAEQVLIAIEELGFRLPDREPIATLVEFIEEIHGGATEAVFEFLDLLEDNITDLVKIFTSEGLPQFGPTQDRIDQALAKLLARRKAFKIDLHEKRELIEKKARETRSFIEPPTASTI